MNEPKTQQHEQSHLKFQLWDKYLTSLNRIWDLEHDGDEFKPSETSFHTTLWSRQLLELNQSWHVSSEVALAPPTSLLGKLLFPLKRLVIRWVQPSIEMVVQRQNDQNAKVVQACNAIVEEINTDAIRRIEAQKTFNSELVQSVNGIVEVVDSELCRIRQEVDEHLNRFQAHFDTVQAHLNTLQTHLDARLEQVEPRLEEFQMAIWAVDRRKEALEIDQFLLNQKLEQALTVLRERGDNAETRSSLPPAERQDDYSYLVFEHRYRGAEELIKDRQRTYLPYFEHCANVLDIGCGRGEFLELLRERGITGYGVELNQTMVAYCRNKDLRVEEHNVFTHLETLQDEALDGIFVAQVVEHCPPAHLLKLLRLCFQKLQSHKYLVIETQNPQSLYALSHFYRDFSHDKPVHPDALQYLLKTAGFQDVNVEYTSPLPDMKLLQELSLPPDADRGLTDQLATLNKNIRQLNEIIYGHLDYAVIARKVNML